MRTATTAPTSMVRDPSVIAEQWKGTFRSGPVSMVPMPRESSNETTVPINGVRPTGTRSEGEVGVGGVTGACSVDDLGKCEFDDVGGPTVA